MIKNPQIIMMIASKAVTWDMMIDTDYSKNKTLLPDFGLGVIQKASYRVVPFSKSKDTREIKRVIIEDQQVKN